MSDPRRPSRHQERDPSLLDDPLDDALHELRQRRYEPPDDFVNQAVLRAVRARAEAEAQDRKRAWWSRVSWFGLTVVAFFALGLVVLSALTPRYSTHAPLSAAQSTSTAGDIHAPQAHTSPDPAEPLAVPVRFVLPTEGAREVALAGEFNGWDPTQTLLRDDDGDGVFHTTLALPRGAYAYMFVVDGERWVTDPFADAYRDDGFGNRNAVLRIP